MTQLVSTLRTAASLTYVAEDIRQGELEASRVDNQHLIALIGLAGAGKSTFGNYLLGHVMERKDPRELGVAGLDEDLVVVKSVTKDLPLLPIAHKRRLQRDLPQVVQDPSGKFYCDCPEFGDIVNAITIKNIFTRAKSVKVVALLNFYSMHSGAEKSRGVTLLAKVISDLFGGHTNVLAHQDAILVGITHVPLAARASRGIDSLKQSFTAVMTDSSYQQEVIDCLSNRLFIYDPLDEPLQYAGSWNRTKISEEVSQLRSIDNTAIIFRTVLTSEDERQLRGFCDGLKTDIEDLFHQPNIGELECKKAADHQAKINQLAMIEHPCIPPLIDKGREVVVRYFKKLIWEYEAFTIDSLESLELARKLHGKIISQLRHFDPFIKRMVKQLLISGEASTQTSQVITIPQLMKNYIIIDQSSQSDLQDLLLSAQLASEQLGERLLENLRSFARQSGQRIDALRQLVEQAEREIATAALSAKRLQQIDLIFSVTGNAIALVTSSAFHCLRLEEQGSDITMRTFQGGIGLVLYARIQEIEFIKQQLTIIEQQDDHEWTIALKIHTQKMDEEAQRFDQLLAIDQLEQRQTIRLQVLSEQEKKIYEKYQEKIRQGHLPDLTTRLKITTFLSTRI